MDSQPDTPPRRFTSETPHLVPVSARHSARLYGRGRCVEDIATTGDPHRYAGAFTRYGLINRWNSGGAAWVRSLGWIEPNAEVETAAKEIANQILP